MTRLVKAATVTSAPDLLPFFLFFVLPLVLLYIGLLVWSTKRDRFK